MTPNYYVSYVFYIEESFHLVMLWMTTIYSTSNDFFKPQVDNAIFFNFMMWPR